MHSTVLKGTQLSPDMSALQHERDFTQIKAWRQHWPTLQSEAAKMNFLIMLKMRRDQFDDLHAAVVFKELAAQWIDERYMP